MQEIERLVEEIDEELDGAEHYAENAVKFKSYDNEKALLYYQMSCDELVHFEKLHGLVEREIRKYREGNKVPDGMQAVYDYLHNQYIEKVKEIKMLLQIYKS